MTRMIYFIEAEGLGFVKIGIATNPRKRLGALQIGSPVALHIRALVPACDAGELEREMHDRFGDAWVRGEWFTLTPELQRTIDKWAVINSMIPNDAWAVMERNPPAPVWRITRRDGESTEDFISRIEREIPVLEAAA